MMTFPRRISALILASALAGFNLLSSGCAPVEPEAIALPVLGAADSSDHADRDCQVVLREAGLLAGGTPVRTVNYQGANHFLMGAVVDVDAALDAAGAIVGLAGEPVWSTEPVEGAPEGMQRYVIEFIGPNTGSSGTSRNGTRMSIIPFVELSDGGRAWDHNRNEGDFDNYRLLRENNFKVPTEAHVCPAPEMEATRWTSALSCDDGAMVVDVDQDDRTHFQMVARDARTVSMLAEQAPDALGALRFLQTPAQMIVEGYGTFGGESGGDFSEFRTVPTFETLDIWASQLASTTWIHREGRDVHLTLTNGPPQDGLSRCSEDRYASRCVVADWVFRDCD